MEFNKRSPDIFGQILTFSGVSFVGTSVLDLGCGYGDLLLASVRVGATRVIGLDGDGRVLNIASEKLARYASDNVEWAFNKMDIDDRKELSTLQYYDIAFCTSVLPYLKNRDMLLSFLNCRSTISFVEMQYYGDGPGPKDIKTDGDMRRLLLKHFGDVKKIGQTYTGRTPPHRSIWKCSTTEGAWPEKAPHPLRSQ